MFIPVLDQDNKPLMPTTPSRARRWIKSGEATPFWNRGIFCVRMNRETGKTTDIVVIGVDPGSKKEGLTVKSESHTYLNIQADAVTWVKKAKEEQKVSRKSRRSRNTPCRAKRSNRTKGGLPPSTRSRWLWKLRLINWIRKMFPVVRVSVEDIKAPMKKGNRKWNSTFSPLQSGKRWFYSEIEAFAFLDKYEGHETADMRERLGLTKATGRAKMSEIFESHCVDSWVLANASVGGHTKPDNTAMIGVTPLKLHRRELHRRQPGKGGIRGPYGSTRSMGLKRGSIVIHADRGVVYIGGSSKNRVSLHSLESGRLLCQNAKIHDITFLTYSTWRTRPIHLTREISHHDLGDSAFGS